MTSERLDPERSDRGTGREVADRGLHLRGLWSRRSRERKIRHHPQRRPDYFQGNLEIQKKRVHRLVETAETLLASVDKDPESAEARLARATFLTGYSRVHEMPR